MSATTTTAASAAATTAEVTKGGNLKKIVLMLVVAALVSGAAWFFLLKGDAAEAEPAPVVEGEIAVLEPQTTTLGNAGLHHARIALGVVLVEGVAPDVVPPKAALLQDALLRELATMSGDDLRSAEGSDGLRDRLSQDAREIWGEDVAVRVVLTELLLQ